MGDNKTRQIALHQCIHFIFHTEFIMKLTEDLILKPVITWKKFFQEWSLWTKRHMESYTVNEKAHKLNMPQGFPFSWRNCFGRVFFSIFTGNRKKRKSYCGFTGHVNRLMDAGVFGASSNIISPWIFKTVIFLC